ncbi:MAG TPA: extracellular solute-binding protein [Candidatus Woesebacteria bacterium]|nr:extracellular solute-binding protein [Candidatus Woesebacteria bacterium]HNS64919.1 extracellular solute-binding protein [Candidatus Woesebacteria bacterium]
MPDLPLPKPTIPTAAPPPPSIVPAKPPVVGVNPPSTPLDSAATVPSKPASPVIPASKVSPSDDDNQDSELPPPSALKATPAPSIQKPVDVKPAEMMKEMKPPAVVTALSSVSSNQIPAGNAREPIIAEKSSAQVRAQTPVLTRLGGSTLPGLGQQGVYPAAPGNLPPNAPLSPGATKNTPSPQPPLAAYPPKIAQTKRSPLRFLPIIVGGLALLLAVIFGASRLLGGSNTTPVAPSASVPPGAVGQDGQDNNLGNNGGTQQAAVTLEYWGLWEPSEVMETIFKEFESQNPGITVQYVSQSHRDYRERLQTAIASKTGPDLFRFHASWAPMLARELAPLPANVLTTTDFESAFYPVARAQLTINETIVGLPVMYDGLMLYYNKDIFQTAGIQPPKTWSELRTAAATLTIREGDQIKRAGVALGNVSNVEHFSDILALLMLQNGAKLESPNSPEGRDALLFYTNFLTQDKVWSDIMPSSTVAFARGDVAMMIAPSWRAFEIQAINPSLQFATSTVPQLANERLTWASYWAEGVNALSTKQDAAWKLLQYMSSNATQKKLYAAQAQVRSFGEPYSRKDLADELAAQPLVSPLLQDAPYARGWYMSSYTHDNGLNDQLIKYYADAVNAIITNKAIQEVLNTLSSGVQQVLTQYNLSSPTSQTAI